MEVIDLEQTREESFVAAVREHRHRVYRVALSILRSPEDAEDAVSEATEVTWKALPRIRDLDSLGIYLTRCTVNAARGILRKRKKEEPNTEKLEQLPAPDPETQIFVYVSGLKEKYRTPVILKFQENMREQDIAAVLHIPRGTVSTRITRAMRMLRIELEEEET